MAQEHDEGGRTAYPGPVDWLCRSRVTGRLVVGQRPNVPLLVGVVATALGWVVDGPVGTALQVVSTLGLAWWAVDELARGVNPFRRLLGAGVLVWIVAGLLGAR